jgi:hypothetical protein
VWQGGDQPPTDPRDPQNPGRRWCEIAKCLLGQKSIIALLRRLGIDPAEFERCLLEHCKRDDRRQQVVARLSTVIPDAGALEAIMSVIDDIQKQ